VQKYKDMRPKLLIVDNYDSFTYNLAQLVSESCLCSYQISKVDKIDLDDIAVFDKILISPGPGLPSETPVLSQLIKKLSPSKSILGICLGLQAIVESFGGNLYNLPGVCHGLIKNIRVTDKNEKLFAGLPAEFEAGVYHSWAASKQNFPDCLKITAVSSDDIIMAVSHKGFDVRGVQFHPESYMTEFGKRIILNWLKLTSP
jgi:anthranilate synthase component II